MSKPNLYSTALALMLAISAQHAQSAPEVNNAAAIRYISGGVGDEDLDMLQTEQVKHRLKMVFTTLDGSFLADVAVLVLDRNKNTLIQAKSEGPVMLLDLPNGTYQVQATYALETISRDVVSQPNRLSTVYFRFGN